MLISNVILKCPAAIFYIHSNILNAKAETKFIKRLVIIISILSLNYLNFTEGFLLELKFILQKPLSLGTPQLKSKNLKALGFQ